MKSSLKIDKLEKPTIADEADLKELYYHQKANFQHLD